jgi:hypothetical protein
MLILGLIVLLAFRLARVVLGSTGDVDYLDIHSTSLRVESCNLHSDLNCKLTWSPSDHQTDTLTFEIKFKTPTNATWLAIGFNRIKKMVNKNHPYAIYALVY